MGMGMRGMVRVGTMRDMPCPGSRAHAVKGTGESRRAESWLGAVLDSLGLGGLHHHEHHHEHAPDHGDGHHKDHHKEILEMPHGHAGHHSDKDNVDFSIFVPAHEGKEPLLSILPMVDEEEVQRLQAAHRENLRLKAQKASKMEDDDESDSDDDDDDDDDHKHKHKHHKVHEHHHHKGKHGKLDKHHKGMMGELSKACDKFGSLPLHVRAGLATASSGTFILAVAFVVAFAIRRGRMSRTDRKERRRQRKEARRAAKTAYKATKARNAKEAEAGFAAAADPEAEALPSYRDNETDALVERM
jgi:hypothetical protein